MYNMIIPIVILTLFVSSSVLGQGNVLVELKDPTRPKNFTVTPLTSSNQKALPPIKVTAIFASPKQHYAVIDGQSFVQGDTIRDYVIESIGRQRVVLAQIKDGITQFTTLSVFEEEVKSYVKQ